jgi:hypothetical protein
MNKNRIRQLAGLPTVRENYALTPLAGHATGPVTVSMGDEFRRIAGLPAIPSTTAGGPPAMTPDQPVVTPSGPATEIPATPEPEIVDEKDEDPTDNAEEEKPAFPEAVMKAAADAEGKTGDELVAIIQHLYDEAVKDGAASMEEQPNEEEEA